MSMDITDTLQAKSDQLNADDIIGSPITVTITEVNRGNADQPLNIKYTGYQGQPFKPSKTVRRLLAKVWGSDAEQWIGKSMTLYNEPTVKWAGKEVGGIRVSHVSHIDQAVTVSLAETRGKKKPHTLKPLANAPQQQPAQPTEENLNTTDIKIRLIKTDGSEKLFNDFPSWLAFMETNLPKIDQLDRINKFEKTHAPIFREYTEAGYSDWVFKAVELITQNKERLGRNNDAPI